MSDSCEKQNPSCSDGDRTGSRVACNHKQLECHRKAHDQQS